MSKSIFYLVLVAACITLLSFTYQQPLITWVSPMEHDFGTIPKGEPAEHSFSFRNTSGDTLFIDNVRPSCGCTSPAWQTTAIPPDSLGKIDVIYDANDQGYFLKKMKVFFSVQRSPEILWIEGDVIIDN